MKSTLIVQGRLASRTARLEASRRSAHGLQVMSMEQAAARLSGGFAQTIDRETMLGAVRTALEHDAGELETIKHLPGMARAVAGTLSKAWFANLDLQERSDHSPRFQALAGIEDRVVEALPTSMLRPADLAARALSNIDKAANVLGSIEIQRLTHIDPCWRDLVIALAEVVPVTWSQGPSQKPEWLDASKVVYDALKREAPEIAAVTCANPRHEAVEAMRWLRGILASGQAKPGEVAIAATATSEFDQHLSALAADAGIELHFVHGRDVTSTADGQACAALAEVLHRGLSRDRVIRLARHLRRTATELRNLPSNWHSVLPPEAPLVSLERWEQALAAEAPDSWEGWDVCRAALTDCLRLLDCGTDRAEEAGERLLIGGSRAIWRKALVEGPAAAIGVTLGHLRVPDGLEPTACAAWMPAQSLASCPRKFVRLLGLSSRAWPRGLGEDPLLPDHLVPLDLLDPLPIAQRDRWDFAAILSSTESAVTLSRSRRDAGGRRLGKSPLVPAGIGEEYLRQTRIPQHASSEADRLLARPSEFRQTILARAAGLCWRDWHIDELTAHDGVVRAGHPVLVRVLSQPQSATSLRLLLRDPIGFVWRYALGWKLPTEIEEPLFLDALEFGKLVHEILEHAVVSLEEKGGWASVDTAQLRNEIKTSGAAVALHWANTVPTPPAIAMRAVLQEAVSLSQACLEFDRKSLDGQQSWTEVPFGTADAEPRNQPWDPQAPVEIPGTGLMVQGKVDRLDLSADGHEARVIDYKTGKVPSGASDMVLAGGKELQRCLYGFAVRRNLPNVVSVRAALAYPREGGGVFDLPEPFDSFELLSNALAAAKESLLAGNAVPGEDASNAYNDLAFALPGNAKQTYCERKLPIARERLGPAAEIWEQP